MGVKIYDQVEITGLSNSGTTDNLGTWNTGVSLSSYVTLPTGASGVLLLVNNGTNAGSRWLGVRATGKTNTMSFANYVAQIYAHVWCPLNGSGQIDLYCQDASTAKFYILAVTDNSWVWNDVDALPTVTSGTSYTTRTLSVNSATTGVLLRGSSVSWAWRPVGQSSTLLTATGTELVKIDNNYQFQNISSSNSSQEILAEIKGGITVNTTWPPTEETPTADGTWRDSTLSIPAGKALAVLRKTFSETSIYWKWRKNGGTFNPPISQLSGVSGIRHYAPVDSSGNFEYNVETSASGNQMITLWLDDIASATGLTITSVTPTDVYSQQVDVAVVGTKLSNSATVTFAGAACTGLSASGSTSLKITMPNFYTNNIKVGTVKELKIIG